MLGLAALALVIPRVLTAPLAWLALALLTGVRIAGDWPLADNHVYLLAYWCIAAAIALRSRNPSETLAASSRRLIGLAFAFAVVWKLVLSPDYRDGRFFRVTFMTDPRVAEVARIVSGLSAADLETNRKLLTTPLPAGAELLDPPGLNEPTALRRTALVATWALVAIELLIALAALMPRLRLDPLHPLLLAFCFTTYAVAPVPGFGWLLLVMGLAQTGDRQRMLHAIYVGMFVLVLFYAEVPWSSWVVTWMTGP
jgi:hypothetical protein